MPLCEADLDLFSSSALRIGHRGSSFHTTKPSIQPWALSSIQGRTSNAGANRMGVRRELTLGHLLPSNTLPAQQTRALVHRSWGLLNEGTFYGEDFYYNEYQEVSSSCSGIKAKLGLKSNHSRYVDSV